MILSLDFGLKRIGVAVGSMKTCMAFPRDPIWNDQHTFDALSKIIQQDRIEKILIGNPLKRDGAPGDIVEAVRQFEQELQKRFSLPIIRVDERYTSKIASQKLANAGISEKAGKKIQDSIAALLLLQEYLEPKT